MPIKQFDTEGDPQKATQVAPQIVGDANIIGLLGPAFSGETKATGPIFFQAGLLSLTASATNPALTTNGWTNFFRGLANDAVQGPAVANYMVKTLGYKKVCVVQDNSDYGVGLAEAITPVLGAAADSSCAAKVKTGDKDFSATVQLVKGEAPDAVFYAGYYAEGAPFVQQLRDGGVTATFVSADGTNDPQFVAQAGASSKDAILSCPCGPAPDAYATEYNELQRCGPRRVLDRGLRPDHDHADRHRLRHHRPGGADRLRQELRRSRPGPAVQVGCHRRAVVLADLDLQGPVAPSPLGIGGRRSTSAWATGRRPFGCLTIRSHDLDASGHEGAR